MAVTRKQRSRVSVVRGIEGSFDEGKNEGWIEFEARGEAVEVEDQGLEVEWGIAAEENLWRITLRRGGGGFLQNALHAGTLMRSAM